MTISTKITTELSSLQAQVAAATPLAQASRATITALQLNAGQLVADVQAALTAPGNALDTFSSPTDQQAIVAGVLNLASVAADQSALSLMRGVTGRATSNLDQLV